MKWTVTLARDLTEYADLIIDASTSQEAEAHASRMIDRNALPPLRWRQGEDREDIRVIDSQEADQ